MLWRVPRSAVGSRILLRTGPSLQTRGLHTSASLRLKKDGIDLFTEKAVRKVSKEDGVGQDFKLIYREVYAHRSHKTFQIFGCTLAMGLYYLGSRIISSDFFYNIYLGPIILVSSLVLITFYNLRMFYRVPHRLYYNKNNNCYKIILSPVIPWQDKLQVTFSPEEICQVDAHKEGWKVTGITKYRLIPLRRLLWMDRDSFHTNGQYLALSNRHNTEGEDTLEK